MRIEDTDRERYVSDAEQYIVDSMKWSGVSFDEGPGAGGDKGPYYQSHRKDIYLGYVEQLINAGHAYYAFDTKEELQEMRDRLTSKENPAPRYDAINRMEMVNSFTMDAEEVSERMERGDPYVVRMKVPEGKTIQFSDIIRGTVAFESSQVDDQILLKSDGMPTYHLANVVDDHLMEITHIIRGEEWLSSTPKHILLYEFFGWDPPTMAHLPLIMSPSGGKLSKRKAEKIGLPINVLEYRDAGYEPEPLMNFLAFLGWNPGTDQEIFSPEELIKAFSIERVGSSAVQFDLNKLKWYNQQFLKSLPIEEVAQRIAPYLEQANISASVDEILPIVELMHERLVLARDFVESARFFFQDPESYDEKGVKKRWKQDTPEHLGGFVKVLDALSAFSSSEIEAGLKSFTESHEIGLGKIMAPLRLALSGQVSGPDLFKTSELLGRETVVRRIKTAVERLG